MLREHIYFKSNKNYYIYDFVNSNIYSCDYSDIHSLINRGSLPANLLNNETFDFSNSEYLVMPENISRKDKFIESFKRNHRYLHLVLTEDCNLRCSYCFYTHPGYTSYRTHRKSSIDLNLAFKAIDNLINSSKIQNNYLIALYGGEVFIEKDKVFAIVKYIRDKYRHSKVTIKITTNGTLLDIKTVEFLVRNDVQLLVSLDGTQEIHDRNRVTIDGLTTYDTIYIALKEIEKKYPNYFSSNLTISGTFRDNHELEIGKGALYKAGFDSVNVTTFVSGNRDFTQNNISITKANLTHFLSAYEHRDIKEIEKFKKLFLEFCFRIESQMYIKPAKQMWSLGRFCAPYYPKVNLQVNGDVTFCDPLEKLVWGHFDANGNISFRFNAIKRACARVLEYRNTFCCSCWAQKLCSICWVHFFSSTDQSLSIEHLKKKCKKERDQLMFKLHFFISLKNYDVDIFYNIKQLLKL